jgi:hypothetical protein
MFRHGQISESAWRYYLYTRNLKDLERFYPLMRGCAEWLIHDTIVHEPDGNIKTRLATDILEAVYPVKNSIYVSCATIRALENAARAAELLGVDPDDQERWRYLASELRKNLPIDETHHRYRYADNAEAPLAYAHSAMVFPFPFDLQGDLARSTVEQSFAAFQSRQAVHEEQEHAVLTDNWLWEVSGLACALFYLGKGDEGLEVLHRIPLIIGPFMTPSEHFRAEGGPYLPWFCTGSGIYTSAIQCMFVQVLSEAPALVLPALPSTVEEATFEDLLASNRVSVSGQVEAGRLAHLTARSGRDQMWNFRMPEKHAKKTRFEAGITVSPADKDGIVTITCSLKRGLNKLV